MSDLKDADHDEGSAKKKAAANAATWGTKATSKPARICNTPTSASRTSRLPPVCASACAPAIGGKESRLRFDWSELIHHFKVKATRMNPQ